MGNPKNLKPEVAARNKALAAAGEVELDALGRKKAGQNVNALEEEEQTWSDPEDRTNTKLVWRRIPPDETRCSVIIKSEWSPWRGNRCTSSVIHGGTVCYHHGGKLPNVKKAAQRRLAMAALPASERLIYMALVKPLMSDADRLKALLAILDRAGVEGKSVVEVEVKPWQEALKRLFERAEGVESPAIAEAEADTIDGEWSDDA